jgi:hypothetical protein
MEVNDDDMMKDWNHDLMIIIRSWRTNESQRQEVKMILKHMAIRSDLSSSTLSNMLSMGEDLKDEREQGHEVQGSPSPQDAHHFFHAKHNTYAWGGIGALHYEHKKER